MQLFTNEQINALGAMGSPCVRPSKDIRARIESALDEIDEINQCHGEHVLMLCTVAVFNSKLLFLFELCLRKWISEIRALQELVVLEARRISMRDQKEQWYKGARSGSGSSLGAIANRSSGIRKRANLAARGHRAQKMRGARPGLR